MWSLIIFFSKDQDEKVGSLNAKTEEMVKLAKLHRLNLFKLQIRILHINCPEQNADFKFPNNFVKTSKYSFLSFVPKNLIEQFMRAANIYFLFISGLQQIPGISPTGLNSLNFINSILSKKKNLLTQKPSGRWTTLGPLLVVLAFTAIKEAFEDIVRTHI